jgi:hypothetical protein
VFGFSAFAVAAFSSLPVSGEVYDATVSETASAATQIVAQATFVGRFQDTAAGSVTVSSLAVLVSTASESAQAGTTVFGGTSVNASVEELAAVNGLAFGAFAQAGDIAEGVSVAATTFAVPNYFGLVVEGGSITDAFSGSGVLAGSVTEGVEGAETFVAQTTKDATVLEAAAVDAAVLSLIEFNSLVSNAASAYSEVSAQGVFAASFSDTVSATDFYRVNLVVNGVVSEGVDVAGLTRARFLWEVIDVSTNGNWAVKNTYNLSDWQTIVTRP